jgi:hypothetical protein
MHSSYILTFLFPISSRYRDSTALIASLSMQSLEELQAALATYKTQTEQVSNKLA